MEETFNELMAVLKNSGLKLVTVIIVIFLGIQIVRNIAGIIKAGLLRSRLDNSLVNFILTLVRFVLYLFLIMYCLSYLGMKLTGLLSALAAVTLAIGLALQNIIAGVANGIMLATTHPFRVNDFVDIGGTSGTVQEINLLHTVLNTPDGKHVYIPNSSVFTSTIFNYSANRLRRMDLNVCVDYSANQEKVRKILLDLAKKNPLILGDPEPQDHYNMSDASSVTHVLRFWVENADYWTVNWDMTERTFEVLKKKGFSVPYPQITVSYRDEDKEDTK